MYPVSNAISVLEKKLDDPWIHIGSFGRYLIHLKGSNTKVSGAEIRAANKRNSVELVSKYCSASAAATADSRIANCEHIVWSSEITVGKSKIELTVPKIANNVVLNDEDVVMVLSQASAKRANMA